MLKRSLVLPVLMFLALSSLAACSGGDDTADTATDPAATPTKTAACDYPDSGTAAKTVDKPSSEAPVEGEVDVTIKTSIGDLHATLDSDATPCTVNSFRSLAAQGYFDHTSCHRLTTPASGISVLQCGDPTGTGSGGPGYSFADELTGNEAYVAGTLAMANAGPDTNGSQFFIVYGASQLSADYTVFGTIDEAGIKLIQTAAAKGTTNGAVDGAPKVPVTIASVS
jgi:peptidyl-prolyl cis-trans isomerase B (cyclophilin B)